MKVPEHLTDGPDAAAARRGPADPPDAADPPGRPPLDARRRPTRSRPTPTATSAPACWGVDRPRADRDPARHQRQGRRGQEHDGPEPRRHLRPGRRADPADGRRPPPAQPRRRLPSDDGEGRPAWSTSSGASSPGSGPSSRPTPNLDFLPTGDTRDIPIEILGTLELRQLLIALSSTTTTG